MPPSAFLDRDAPPSKTALAKTLGNADGLWEELLNQLSANFAPVLQAWSWSGKSHGWILRLRRRERTILYLVPGPGYFTVSFALGEKACRAAETAGLPAPVLDLIRNAPRYAEGRGVRIEVRRKMDLAIVRELASIKTAN